MHEAAAGPSSFFSCFHIIRLSHHTSLILSLPQADRNQNKIKLGRRKENGDGGGDGGGEGLPDSRFLNTRTDTGEEEFRKCIKFSPCLRYGVSAHY